MWIYSAEYNRLKDCERMKEDLEKEVVRLAELVSAEVKDCKVGPWCRGCIHVGYDQASITAEDSLGYTYVKETAGKVQYCKKHLHEICPEFEQL